MRRVLKCDSPNCNNEFVVPERSYSERGAYHFCKKCRSAHSYRVLVIQAQHGYEIREVILDAATMFQSVSGIADYMSVSFVTVYNWLEKYFNMTFQEFKRQHICKSPHCYIIDIQGSAYSRYDYVLKKIKRQLYCACSSVFDKNKIMTNAPLSVVQDILRGGTQMEKITDDSFMVVPEPVKVVFPVHICVFPVSISK